jgi:hypothetical protein
MCSRVFFTGNWFERTCFLPWYEVNSSDQQRKILGDALPSGALVCNLESTDIKAFMMSLCSKFYGDECDSESEDEEPLTRLLCVWVDNPTPMFMLLGQICSSSVMELSFQLKINCMFGFPV